MGVSGPQLLLVGFNALSEGEQEEAFELISECRMRRLAGEEGTTARMIRSLQRISEHLGNETMNTTSYRRAWAELREQGEEVENLSSVIRYFGGWKAAREAFDLSATTTSRRIEVRFAKRKLGRAKQYSADTLGECVAQAMKDLGISTPPRLAEYLHWRRGKEELARAQGDPAPQIPGGGPFRRFGGSWAGALRKLGYSEEEIADRLDRRE